MKQPIHPIATFLGCCCVLSAYVLAPAALVMLVLTDPPVRKP